MQKKSLARSLLWILKYPSLRRFALPSLSWSALPPCCQ